jgi:1-phosphofructokinase family hexose kinase
VIVFVAGSPCVDRLVEVQRLERGAIHRPSSVVTVPGGKGINAARAARTLGAEVVVVAILQGDAGRWIERELLSNDVRLEAIWAPGETRWAVSIAERDAPGQLTEVYEPATGVPMAAWNELEVRLRDLLPAAERMVLSGSLPRSVSAEGHARLVSLAHECRVEVAMDVGPRWLRTALPRAPDLVKVNLEEARATCGLHDAAPIVEAARQGAEALIHAGARQAVVTAGVAGLVAAAPGTSTIHIPSPARGDYPVGSGDASLGGLTAGLATGLGWEDAVALAAGAGSANAELPGAGRLDPERAREFAARARENAVVIGEG